MKPAPWWVWGLLIVGGALGVRELFPKTVVVAGPPRIETQYDTVRVMDTAWVMRVRRETVTVNVTERITVTVPETIYAAPRVVGIVALQAGAKPGDSSLVAGFTLEPLDSGYTRRDWQAQFYTLGPVRSLVVDPTPRLTFYDPPAPPCKVLCIAKYKIIGGLVGFGLGKLF
jgi:hypothetical protein